MILFHVIGYCPGKYYICVINISTNVNLKIGQHELRDSCITYNYFLGIHLLNTQKNIIVGVYTEIIENWKAIIIVGAFLITFN